MSDASLRPRTARVFYNVADAWIAPGDDGALGAGDLDLLPHVEAALADSRERARLARLLRLLEWMPRIALRSRRGFSWQPREVRRAWLECFERSRCHVLREPTRRMHALVDEAYRAASERG